MTLLTRQFSLREFTHLVCGLDNPGEEDCADVRKAFQLCRAAGFSNYELVGILGRYLSQNLVDQIMGWNE